MNIGIIMAGGVGSRMKLDIPKQFLLLKGKPMIAYSLIGFETNAEVDKIFVVCSEDCRKTVDEIIKKEKITKFAGYSAPGETRRLSSKNAVDTVYGLYGSGNILLIHDAARPGISQKIISDNIETARKTGACCTVINVRDTMCKTEGDFLGKTVDRSNTVQLQTPQTFSSELIKESHDFYEKMMKEGKAVPEITDDTGLVRFFGHEVATVKGSTLNMKITEPGDEEMFSGNNINSVENN